MSLIPDSITQLIDELGKLPGIGRKSAKRLAFSLMMRPQQDSINLAETIKQSREKIHLCPSCFSLTDLELCVICQSQKRDHQVICVVEDPRNVFTIEGSGIFNGVYHVLGGTISPLKGISPKDLTISALQERVEKQTVRELIIATNPTIEGEATAHFLTDLFKDKISVISRIARGIPSGADMEFADTSTLTRAFEGRTAF